jgi:tetratricopeptide (TPR) repeat protein
MAAEASDQMNSAGALYTKSVDLANAGKYAEALEISDEALAMNVTSLVPLIQSNRAGILVMLGRFEDANAAADAALTIEGNLTIVHSIAWYNKGNALRSLGRLNEAKTAYAKAYDLDKSLVPPDLSSDTVAPTPAKSPKPSGIKIENWVENLYYLIIGILLIGILFDGWKAIKNKK